MSYIRDYEKSFQRYDRFLRLVRSIDEAPGKYLLERKSRYLDFPDLPLGTDRARRYNHGYRRIMEVAPNELQYVLRSLYLSDVQRLGGAKALAEQLTLADDKASELADRATRDVFDDISSEAYDYLAWREGRRVSLTGASNG